MLRRERIPSDAIGIVRITCAAISDNDMHVNSPRRGVMYAATLPPPLLGAVLSSLILQNDRTVCVNLQNVREVKFIYEEARGKTSSGNLTGKVLARGQPGFCITVALNPFARGVSSPASVYEKQHFLPAGPIADPTSASACSND